MGGDSRKVERGGAYTNMTVRGGAYHNMTAHLTHSSYVIQSESSASSRVCFTTPHKASGLLKQDDTRSMTSYKPPTPSKLPCHLGRGKLVFKPVHLHNH